METRFLLCFCGLSSSDDEVLEEDTEDDLEDLLDDDEEEEAKEDLPLDDDGVLTQLQQSLLTLQPTLFATVFSPILLADT